MTRHRPIEADQPQEALDEAGRLPQGDVEAPPLFELSEPCVTGNRLTAAEMTDVLLSNTGGGVVYFEITETDYLPLVYLSLRPGG